MKYAIVYSSRTGNTRLLAETVRKRLPEEDCLYFGEPDDRALKAERIYVGFWTDRGTCDGLTAEFLQKLTGQEVYLFGTAGFTDTDGYYSKILGRAEENISRDCRILGRFLCQGKMPAPVRTRYEEMLRAQPEDPRLQAMIRNFDLALSHPDEKDLQDLSAQLG